MCHRSQLGVLVGLASAVAGSSCANREGGAGPFQQQTPGFYQEVSWSPDGQRLLVSVLEFMDGDPGYTYRIWQVNPERSTAVPLTDGPKDYWTTWSPDGGRIAFAAPGDGGALDIFVMNPDGTGRQRLTSAPGDDTHPAWSPDGRQLAFVSARTGSRQLWVMNADGTAPRQLVHASREVHCPAWAPDGAHLAYYESDGRGADDVVVVRADGSNRRQLAKGVWPTWMPDGASVLYSAEGGLYHVALAGGSPLLLVSGDLEAAEMSRDGTRLAYVRQDSTAVQVVVSGPAGERARVVMTRPAPKW